MGQLILEKDLQKAEPGDPVYTLAQARTSTVITRLDAERNRSVSRFLTDSHLTGEGNFELGGPSVELLSRSEMEGAALGGAVLPNANLKDADLNDADLGDALLFYADFTEADLSEADLSGATLDRSELVLANLSCIDDDLGPEMAEKSCRPLSGAGLSGANLSGADLSGAKGVRVEQLADANSLEGATMPRLGLSEHARQGPPA